MREVVETTDAPVRSARRTFLRRLSVLLGSLVLSVGMMLGTAAPASAADFALTYVQPRAYAWSLNQSYSGSCYLGNGVSWTFSARWNFGYTARTSVRVNSVQVSYRITSGGNAGGAYLIDSRGGTAWQGYNNRNLPAGTTYSQTFNLGGRVVTQGPSGISFRVLVTPGNCGGARINATFNVRSL